MGEHFKRFKTIGGFKHCVTVVSENPAGKLTNLALVLGNQNRATSVILRRSHNNSYIHVICL
jgi:hypothetical protein